MPVDASVFNNLKTFQDYQRADEEFQLKKALAQAQVQKAGDLDLDKVGETAFAKIVAGHPLESLSPVERAGAQWVQNKSGGVTMDAAGNLIQKPKIFDNVGGFSPASAAPSPAVPAGSFNAALTNPKVTGDGDFLSVVAPTVMPTQASSPQDVPTENQWDVEYQKQYNALAGNPKAQQALTETYAKSKVSMSDSEAKNAGYADRLLQDQPILNDPEKIKAYGSGWQKALDFINPFGDGLNSSEYQSYNQARRDATEARLRAASGAAIANSEYKNDDLTLYPQIGDSPEVLAQKTKNQEALIKSHVRAAGPAYKSPPTLEKPTAIKAGSKDYAESLFLAKKAIKDGKNPEAVRKRLIDAGIDPAQAGL